MDLKKKERERKRERARERGDNDRHDYFYMETQMGEQFPLLKSEIPKIEMTMSFRSSCMGHVHKCGRIKSVIRASTIYT